MEVKAIALLFLPTFVPFSKMEKWLKMDEKLRLQPYFFAIFYPFFKNGKMAKNGRKVKAIIAFS